MWLSRRRFIQAGTASLGSLGLVLAGCSTSASNNSTGAQTVLWIWPEGFGKAVLDAVAAQFPDRSLRQDIIGGDFKQKLTTTFTAGSGLPDITGVKGEDMSFFRQHAEYFIDLNTLGAEDIKSIYLESKWAQATTADGKQIGIPIDIGPTAMFYRFDVFQDAGLPYEPEAVAAAVQSWDDYFTLGKELLAAKPDTYLIRNTTGIFSTVWPQSGIGLVEESGKWIADGEHVRQAWDTALKALDAGIIAKIDSNTADAAAAVNEGRLPADLGASWHLADLMVDAPETSGKWHVCAHPGNAINNGGSFLTVPAGVADAKSSMEMITFILNPENQVLEYVDKGYFPSAVSAFEDPKVTGEVEFLGGQKAAEVFASAAKTVKYFYEDPNQSALESPFTAQLQLVEADGKDRDQAWDEAVQESKRVAQQAGLSV